MLRGRRAEQAVIDESLDAARNGRSAALVIRGEPGIGKSALLEYARGRAGDLRVLRASGIESEATVPFAGLHLLLRGSLDRLDALPGPQRRALEGAFGLGEASGDRFMLGAAVLSLLAEVAEDGPVLCVVDDAHWLDRVTAEALLFAARRLDREGVVMLFAARDYGSALASSGLTELRLSGLDATAAAELLADGGWTLSPAVREHLIAATEGNPLALLELPRVVASQGIRPGPIQLTSRVVDAFQHQVRALPEPSRTALLVAAADDTGDLAVVLAAAERLGVGVDELQLAEAGGLVAVDAEAIAFRHPLIRAAVYHGATLGQRIAAHGALATTAAESGDVERNAWHLAIAATAPDETIAASLEQAALHASARGGHAAAASGFERAAQLTPDPVAAFRRIVLACEAGIASGQLDWARSRAQRALPRAADAELRARLLDVEARAELAAGALGRAHGLLLTAAELAAKTEPDRAFWMLIAAVHAAWAAPTDERLLAEPADRIDDLGLDPSAPVWPVASLVRWSTAVALGRDPTGYPDLDETIRRARTVATDAGSAALVEVASFSFMVGRDELSAEVCAELVTAARSEGTLFALPIGLGQLALTQTLLGRHREALISGTEAVRIARDTGQPMWERYASGALAYLAAIEGSEERCARHAADAELEADAPSGAAIGTVWGERALALLDLGRGRVGAAYDRLWEIRRGATRHQSAVIRSVPDLVEAAVRLDRADSVSEAVADYERWAVSLDATWIDALLARCRALLAADDAEEHFTRALALHDHRPFERARTSLLYGEWLRRARRRGDARVHLGAALRLFEELGSAPWADRARAELGASGVVTAGSAPPDVFAGLTPQELQISQLAAQGLSNRDIAAQLYLSPRTVAYHLYKAYPKLGIASRTELAELIG